MPIFKIQHITTYEYDRLIQESMNEIKIFPVHFCGTGSFATGTDDYGQP